MLDIYVCGDCISTKRALKVGRIVESKLKGAQLRVIDVLQDGKSAKKFNVVMTPCFLLNGNVINIGVPSVDQLIGKIKKEYRNNR